MKHKGFNVTVHTSLPQAGTEIRKTTVLAEYPPQELVSNNIKSTYIASQAGQQFSIHVENDSDSDASVLFYVDGQMASCLLCYAKPKYNSAICYGIQPEAGSLRKFIFRKASLTDEAESMSSAGDEIGVIRVVIRRCTILSFDANPTFMQFNLQSQVDEKTQKGLLDTRTELQDAEPYKAGPYATVVYKDLPVPWAEFSFTYKSMNLLEALDVVKPVRDVPLKFPKATLPQKRPNDDNHSLQEENKRSKVYSCRTKADEQMELSRLRRQGTEPLSGSHSSSSKHKTQHVVINKVIPVVDLTED